MANVLAQIARSKDIYLTLSLWSMLLPKLAGAKASQHLLKEDSNKKVVKEVFRWQSIQVIPHGC
jgi:hypothetical protein